MRCNNCGWVHNEPALKCEKCNYALDGSLNINQVKAPSNDFTNQGLSKTISGKKTDLEPWDVSNTGELHDDPIGPNHVSSTGLKEQSLPFVKEDHSENARNEERPIDDSPPIAQKPMVNNFNQTIDPSRLAKSNSSFSLKPIARQGEDDTSSLFFAEESVDLTRSNTDPNNMTITSKVQAVIENVDGVWYLLDKSSLKTTFKQTDEPTKLKSGDVILMGDRKFIFEI